LRTSRRSVTRNHRSRLSFVVIVLRRCRTIKCKATKQRNKIRVSIFTGD